MLRIKGDDALSRSWVEHSVQMPEPYSCPSIIIVLYFAF